MRTRKRRSVVGVAALSILALAGAVLAQDGPDGWGHGRDGGRGRRSRGGAGGGRHGKSGLGGGSGLGRMSKELGLTEDQTAKLKELRTNRREGMQAAMTKVREARGAIRDAVVAGQGEDKIRALAKQLSDAVAAGAILGAKAFGEALQVLTPEQQKTFQSLMEKQRKLREKRRRAMKAWREAMAKQDEE